MKKITQLNPENFGTIIINSTYRTPDEQTLIDKQINKTKSMHFSVSILSVAEQRFCYDLKKENLDEINKFLNRTTALHNILSDGHKHQLVLYQLLEKDNVHIFKILGDFGFDYFINNLNVLKYAIIHESVNILKHYIDVLKIDLQTILKNDTISIQSIYVNQTMKEIKISDNIQEWYSKYISSKELSTKLEIDLNSNPVKVNSIKSKI